MSKSGNYSIGKSVLKYPRGDAEVRRNYTYRLQPRSIAFIAVSEGIRNNDNIPKEFNKRPQMKSLTKYGLAEYDDKAFKKGETPQYRVTKLGKRKQRFVHQLSRLRIEGRIDLDFPSKLSELIVVKMVSTNNTDPEQIHRKSIIKTSAEILKYSPNRRMDRSSHFGKKYNQPLLQLLSDVTDANLQAFRKTSSSNIEQWLTINLEHYEILENAAYGKLGNAPKKQKELRTIIIEMLTTCIKEDGLTNPQRFGSIMNGVEVFY